MLPGLLAGVGLVAMLAGIANAIVPFSSHGRSDLIWLVFSGLFVFVIGTFPIVIVVRTVQEQDAGTFRFKSLLREYYVQPENILSIVGPYELLDAWGVDPVLVTTTNGRFLLARQLHTAAELERRLVAQNPQIRTNRSLRSHSD